MLVLLRETFAQWTEAKAPRLGAALAFYAVISLAPLLIFLLAVVGSLFGQQAAEGKLVDKISTLVGQPVAEVVQEVVRQADQPWSGVLPTIIGIVVLLFGASGIFSGLQDALNTIWRVAPKPDRWLWEMIRERFVSILLVLFAGLLLLASVVLTSVLTALARGWDPPTVLGVSAWTLLNLVISFAVITLLFAMIYKMLPDAKVHWGDVWVGAIGTALLFILGRDLLAVYLAYFGGASSYGAAGSLVVLLLWIYYTAQILLFGAAFTRVYAQRFGTGVQPTANAMALNAEDLAREGILLRKLSPEEQGLPQSPSSTDAKR
jgi:membrane protein